MQEIKFTHREIQCAVRLCIWIVWFRSNLVPTVASPTMGHWDTWPPPPRPRLTTISFSVHFGEKLRANYPSIM